jgi:glycosyltransferase involved in cell wall biosynthesis
MDIEAKLQRGEALFMDGLLDQAEKVFQEVLHSEPAHFEALNNLGVISHNRGIIDQAEHFFQKALEANGEYPDALINLADLYKAANQNEKELDCLEKLLAFQPNSCDLLNRLALLYIEIKQEETAIPLIERSLKLHPEQGILKKTLSSLLSDSGVRVKKRAWTNTHTPLVTVGLPVYNGGKYLAEAIESLLVQDFEGFELIISDNNSTDQTGEICNEYQKHDKRIRYVRHKENIGMKLNFLNVLGLARGQYFMFATHDDRHEKVFMSKCIKVLQADNSVSLVYPQTKMLNSNSEFLGIAKDHVKADQNDPVERFRHLIWELSICNMMLGIFCTHILKTATSWGMSLFGDTLLLAEVALSGKILQIPEPLFIRRFTRDYNYQSPDERYAQLMGEGDPNLFNQGLYLPHCRLTFAHLDLLNNTAFDNSCRDALMREVITCFKTRYGPQMKYEIDRAKNLISNGICYWTWRNDRSEAGAFTDKSTLGSYRISTLLKNLQEALLIYPERSDLFQCYVECLKHLDPSEPSSFRRG